MDSPDATKSSDVPEPRLGLFKFQLGRSYMWLFWSFAFVFVAALIFSEELTYLGVIFPIFFLLLVVLELRSGVALNSCGVATHPRGTWKYNALIAWHTLAFVVFFVMACLDFVA